MNGKSKNRMATKAQCEEEIKKALRNFDVKGVKFWEDEMKTIQDEHVPVHVPQHITGDWSENGCVGVIV